MEDLIVRRLRVELSPYKGKNPLLQIWLFIRNLFLTEPVRFQWELWSDWQCSYGIVPKGTKVEGATIPRILWWFLSPTGWLFEASVWHDYCYQTGRGTKAQSDLEFYQLALLYNTPKLLAKVAYLFVKWFGKGIY